MTREEAALILTRHGDPAERVKAARLLYRWMPDAELNERLGKAIDSNRNGCTDRLMADIQR